MKIKILPLNDCLGNFSLYKCSQNVFEKSMKTETFAFNWFLGYFKLFC